MKVKCKVSIESEHGHFDGETLDLSLNGMLIRAGQILPIGSTVNVTLMLPPVTAPVALAAHIVGIVGNELIEFQLRDVGKDESDRLGEFLVPLIVSATG